MEKFSVLGWHKKEVVFVVTVLAVIFGVSFYQLRIGEMKARDAQRKSDVELVARAMERYFSDYQVYPAALDGKIVACGYLGSVACEWGGGPVVDKDNVVYLKDLPRDPKYYNGQKYVYTTDAERQNFRIFIGLETRSDQAYKNNLTEGCGNNVQCSWYAEN